MLSHHIPVRARARNSLRPDSRLHAVACNRQVCDSLWEIAAPVSVIFTNRWRQRALCRSNTRHKAERRAGPDILTTKKSLLKENS